MIRHFMNISAVLIDDDTGAVELYATATDGTCWRLDEAHRAERDPGVAWVQLPSLPAIGAATDHQGIARELAGVLERTSSIIGKGGPTDAHREEVVTLLARASSLVRVWAFGLGAAGEESGEATPQ